MGQNVFVNLRTRGEGKGGGAIGLLFFSVISFIDSCYISHHTYRGTYVHTRYEKGGGGFGANDTQKKGKEKCSCLLCSDRMHSTPMEQNAQVVVGFLHMYVSVSVEGR